MEKIKRKNKISIKECTNCFNPIYLKFNFSYICYDDNFDDKHKIQLLERIRELSKQPYNVLRNLDKKISLEFEDKDKLGINKQIPTEFSDRYSAKVYNNKLAIFRLYTNNNPIIARVIGVIIKNIFYIIFIDIGGKLYKH